MRIVIAADVLGEKNNGTSMATYNLIDYLKSKGHEIRVICGDKDKVNWPNFYIVKNVNFGILNGYVEENGVTISKPDMKTIISALKGADLVHITMPFTIGGKTAQIANSLGIPITASFHVQAENVTSHFFLMHSKIAHNAVYKAFYNRLYRYADCIHFPTSFINTDFEKVAGPTNAYIISNGVKSLYRVLEAEKPKEFADKFVILYTGRYSREKMHKTLIKAMKYTKYEKKIQLIFAGDGPLRKKIEKDTAHFTNKPILGLHPGEELVRIINYSDLYVHCAYAELESIACLEAIKCGLVPVINNSPKSATRFFARDPDCLYKKNNPKSLAKQIDYWIEHEEERLALKQEYVKYSGHFDFDMCMSRMEKMMFEAVEIRKYKKEHGLTNRVVAYVSELDDDFSPTHDISLKRVKVMDDYKYVHKNIFWRINAFILYDIIAKPILGLLTHLWGNVKIHNRKEVKKLKHTGYFIYGNHTAIQDAFIPQTRSSLGKRVYIVANPDAISIHPIVTGIVKMLGCLPLPNSLRSSKNFLDAIKTRIEKKDVILIYPEAHIWPYSTVIRDYLDTSFLYPAKLNKPIIPICATYRKRKSLNSKKVKKPYMDVYVGSPIYPKEGLSAKENAKYLRDEAHKFMLEIASKNDNYAYINYIKAPEDTAKINVNVNDLKK